MTIVYQGDIAFSRFLNSSGTPEKKLPDWAEQPTTLLNYYRQMVLSRQFDYKAVSLQRTGQLGTYPSLLGSEAIDVVTASLMHSNDVLIPYYRNAAMQMIRGVDMSEILLYWGGDEIGSATPGMGEDFPNCVPIATQALHACGVASAFRIKGEARAAVTLCGDGATSKGDFLEALNVAGAWQLPVVFIVNNNQWAISVPRAIQCGAPTLAQKAIGAGIRGEQVDGNDPIAMHESVSVALERAREGKGPSLIEAISYRLSDHTTADDASRYRADEELQEAWQHEPVKRLREFLVSQDWWGDEQEQALLADCEQQIDIAVERYRNTPPQAATTIIDYLYAELPDSLYDQRAILAERTLPGGDDHE